MPLEGGDQLPSAEQVAELGLGLHVQGPVPLPQDVRRAVTRVLGEPSFAATARRFQAQMQALPPLHVAMADLEALAKGHSLET